MAAVIIKVGKEEVRLNSIKSNMSAQGGRGGWVARSHTGLSSDVKPNITDELL